MRLKQQREDVKDLRLMADAHVQDIAKRYLNLIRMVEESELLDQLVFTDRTKRVLKDSEP